MSDLDEDFKAYAIEEEEERSSKESH